MLTRRTLAKWFGFFKQKGDPALLPKLKDAISEGNEGLVRSLLRQGANANTREKTSFQIQNFIDLIVMFPGEMKEDVVEFKPERAWLIGYPENMKKDAAKLFPKYVPACLLIAADKGHLNIVKLLMEKGVDVDTEVASIGLFLAAQKGHLGVAKLLVEKGADVNARIPYLASCIEMAADKGHFDMVKFLIEKGAEIHSQRSTFLRAARKNNYEIVELLLDKLPSSYVNAQNSDTGVTALMEAALHGNVEMVKALLERGAKVDIKARNSGTALVWTSRRGHKEIVNLLLAAGAEVNAQDAEGSTALHRAALGGYHEVVSALLENGANMRVKDNSGKTALDVAKKYAWPTERNSFEKVIDLLENAENSEWHSGEPARSERGVKPIAEYYPATLKKLSNGLTRA